MTIEQLRELIERLQGDQAAQVTNEELSQAQEFIRDQRRHLAGQEPNDDVIAALTELVDARTAITQVVDTRAAEVAQLEERRQALLNDLGDDTPADNADAPAGDADAAPTAGADQPAADAGTPAGDPAPVGDPAQPAPTADVDLPVAASGQPAPRRAPIGTFRTPGTTQAPAPNPNLAVRTTVTAAGGSPRYVQGQRITSTADLALAMTDRIKSMAAGRVGPGSDKVYVANVHHEYPDARTLNSNDWVGNFSKIEDATSEQALVAAGGLCAPLQVLYDVQVIGSVNRPVKGALAAFQVDRGGIQFRPNSSAATALTTGTGTGVDTWTMETDAGSDTTGDTKGCYVVDCPGVEEATVQAIYLCLEFSNITARFDPETTAANIRQGMIAHARRAENELLRALQAGSKVLSAAKVIGAARDFLTNIDHASAYYRNRHRIDTDVNLTMIAPAWVRFLMRTDIARQMAAGDWMSALNITDQMIDGWFAARGVNPVWHLDGQLGGTNETQQIAITGGPTGGSFTLTWSGQTTAAIAYNASAADVRSALAALSNIRLQDVSVGGGALPGTPVTVTFGGQYAHTNVAQMTATSSLTGGTSPAVNITTTTASSLTEVVNGVSIASQVYADAAAGSAIPGYPDQVDALFFVTGTKLFLDGGNLDLGLVRDSALNSRNRYRQFSETFEGVADRGIENLRLAMTLQPTGQTSGTADLSAVND